MFNLILAYLSMAKCKLINIFNLSTKETCWRERKRERGERDAKVIKLPTVQFAPYKPYKRYFWGYITT